MIGGVCNGLAAYLNIDVTVHPQSSSLSWPSSRGVWRPCCISG